MSTGKLGKKLLTELKRNKQKSAILAVTALVALYFWVPLARKMMFGAKPAAAPATVVQAAAPVSTTNVPTLLDGSPLTPATETKQGWDMLATWMEQDRYMQPAAVSDELFNPFAERIDPAARNAADLTVTLATAAGAASVAAHAADKNLALNIAEEQKQDGAKLGLALQATIVGRRKRLATINGFSYAEGSAVEVFHAAAKSADDEPGPAILSEVNRGYVLLRYDHQLFRLEITTPKLSPGSHVAAH